MNGYNLLAIVRHQKPGIKTAEKRIGVGLAVCAAVIAVVIAVIAAYHRNADGDGSTLAEESGAGYAERFAASVAGTGAVTGAFTREVTAPGSHVPVTTRGTFAQTTATVRDGASKVLDRTLAWREIATAAGRQCTITGVLESATAAGDKGAVSCYRMSERFGGSVTGVGSGTAEGFLARQDGKPVRYGTFVLSSTFADMTVTDTGTYEYPAAGTGQWYWKRTVTVKSGSHTTRAVISGTGNGSPLNVILCETPAVEFYLASQNHK